MSVVKTYQPKNKDKWYSYWMEKDISILPPMKERTLHYCDTTSQCHRCSTHGSYAKQYSSRCIDSKARMQGYNTCWVPGTDHASIATEAKVVQKLANDGIDKSSLSREEFMKHAWEWKEKHGGIILEQLKKLGASHDWERTKFTMDQDMSAAVIKVFVDLHQKGLVYRGVRMVNWDPTKLPFPTKRLYTKK